MNSIFKSPVLEVFLVEVILYLLLWLWNNYMATLLTIALILIFMAIWVISKSAEFFSETTPVPKIYFSFVTISIFAPILSSLIAVTLMGIPFWTPGS